MFEKAKEALQIEADSILELLPRVDDQAAAPLDLVVVPLPENDVLGEIAPLDDICELFAKSHDFESPVLL